MNEFSMVHYASSGAGVILVLAISYTLIMFSPTPLRNMYFGAVAACLFAFSTGTKFVVNFDRDKGFEMRVAELNRQLNRLESEAAAIQSQQAHLAAQAERIASNTMAPQRVERAFAEIDSLKKKYFLLTHQSQAFQKQLSAVDTAQTKLAAGVSGLAKSVDYTDVSGRLPAALEGKKIMTVDPERYAKALDLLIKDLGAKERPRIEVPDKK